MKLIIEYNLKDVVNAYRKESLATYEDRSELHMLYESLFFGVLYGLHCIDVDFESYRLRQLTRIDLTLANEIISDYVTNDQFRELAYTLNSIEVVKNIKHIGYQTYEVYYEEYLH